LALWQAEAVRDALGRVRPDLEIELKVIRTSGDWSPVDGEKRLQTKGDFAKEIEQALLAGVIDIAVHSMKDMETILPDGLVIDHMLVREDVRDCLLFSSQLAGNSQKFFDLSEGAVVGTASVRRQAYVLSVRPDLSVVPMRGNVQTRIEKVRGGQVDMSLLAYAGLKRLGLADEADVILEPEEMLPAAGQGAVGIEFRGSRFELRGVLDEISCTRTVFCVSAERAALAVLDGSCHTPIGAYAMLQDDGGSPALDGSGGTEMWLRVSVLRLDGSEIFEDEERAVVLSRDDAVALGRRVGERLKARIPAGVLAQKVDE